MKVFRIHSHRLRKRTLLLSAIGLVLFSFLTSWYFDSQLSISYQQRQLQHYVTAQQEDARRLVNNTALMGKLVTRQESQDEFDFIAKKNYGFFLFAETLSGKEDLLFWNSQIIIPPQVDFRTGDEVVFRQLLNGYYIIQKTRLTLPGMSNNLVVYVLIPVLYKYYLETENSQTKFAHDPSATKRIALAERAATKFPIVSLDKKPLFYLQRPPAGMQSRTDPVSVVLRITALVLLLVVLHMVAQDIRTRRGGLQGVLFLAVVLLFVRVLLYLFPQLFSLRQFELFDPLIYGSNTINRSLGDLLINAVFLCWIVLFAWNFLGPLKELPRFLQGRKGIVAGSLGVFLLMFVTFQFAGMVNALVKDSKISFDVTDFSQLTVYTGISFVILALLSLSYYYFSRLLFRIILLLFPNLVSLYFTVAVAGLLFLSFQREHSIVLFQLPVLFWLVLYSLVLTQEQSIFNRFRITIAGILFWIFVFSVSLAVLIMQANRERELRERRSVATNYEEQLEPTKVMAVSVGLTVLDERFLKNNFNRFYQEIDNELIRDSIQRSSFSGYSNAYSTSIYVFDSAYHGVNNPDDRTYDELNNIYTTHGQATEKKGLVSYEVSPTQVVYLVKREAFDSTKLLGTLFLVAAPRQYQGKEKFYPDIFRRMRPEKTDPVYIYAVYQNKQLNRYTGSYSFPIRLKDGDVPESEFAYFDKGDYNELWYKASNHKIIIVARKKDSLIESITLFSYLFCAFLFMVSVIRSFELLSRVVQAWPKVEIFSRLNIRSQIHVTIIFISILSFLVIGVATITYFVQRYKRTNIENLSLTSSITLNELQKKAKEDSLALTAGTFDNAANTESLKQVVRDISDVHGVIVNLYDTSGLLQITSDDQIYRKGILSTRMDPTAYYHLSSLDEVQKVQTETNGDIDYESIYTIIRNPKTNEKVAFLNIPSSATASGLSQEISNFLVTIINLNAFIVLIAGVIALFITNRITRTFSVISNKMKEITLGRSNEEIAWSKEDEIGELVKQYNKMVKQLENSASALAKSEREGAWREMARQVAHEIKNPLTPMKLSIQYLQKAIQNNQPNVKDLTTNVAHTLIEQIDHLSKIAADFSQFANIGNRRLEMVDLHNVIGSLLDLFATNPKVQVTWNPIPGPARMQVDKTHMNRLFTNLLANAVDACSERQKCQVSIREEKANGFLIVAIQDNGDGIPEEMQSKIFTPNFTTKTSGTGLGLAMCKGIVEQAGGDIWFQTVVGEGTTFFVKLPFFQ
ncbi:sensor histidine kinase [Flavisolibacter nicotianae]|uniref:sensor histidine kinase n=1 Tax=Flavisolibacter nicotianae TaxID=2364882 RepID=UPI000EACFCA0|nr:HAMP domain-containing sensor histidine kinase [Flavisolibacter nicotianae]